MKEYRDLTILNTTEPDMVCIYKRCTGDWLLPRLAVSDGDLAVLARARELSLEDPNDISDANGAGYVQGWNECLNEILHGHPYGRAAAERVAARSRGELP